MEGIVEKETQILIQKAQEKDYSEILSLINDPELKGIVLKKTREQLKENQYFVAFGGGKVIGTVGYKLWNGLSELVSLVVKKEHRGGIIGNELAKKCLEELKKRGHKRVFALTGVPSFFEKLGFEIIDVKQLPDKINGDCKNCPKNINGPTRAPCKEVALIKNL